MKYRIIILVFCALIPTIYTQCTIERAETFLKRVIYEFSVKLSTRISQETENHFITSPISIWKLLACTSIGAAGETLAELKQVLKLHSQQCFNKKYMYIAKDVNIVNETNVFLESSSAIFVKDKSLLKKSYKKKVRRAGISKIEVAPFDDLENAANAINSFVSKGTNGIINDMVAPSDLDNVIIMMIDALFFKGAWTNPFEANETEESAFYNHNQEQIGDVNMMFTSNEFNVGVLPLIKADVLELPYGDNKRYSMLIILPKKNVLLSTVIDNLSQISLATIRYSLNEYGPQDTIVQLPRFKISSDHNNLRELLTDMGLRTAFDSNLAQFPNLSDEQLHISNFIQKADIEVTEEGTTAAAATEELLSARTIPGTFNVDKPFFFMIIDNVNDIPIFMGAYSKPTLY